MLDYEKSTIALEQFSPDKLPAALQAWRVNKLVKNAASWLQTEQPGTVARYEELLKAHHNIRRLAGSKAIQAYIIHSPAAANIGLATVIQDQDVVHPQEGRIEGDDIDYWLNVNTNSIHMHSDVAGRLCMLQAGRPTFSTVLKSGKHALGKGIGFSTHMNTVGEPAGLSTTIPGDPYGVTKEGALCQIYQLA